MKRHRPKATRAWSYVRKRKQPTGVLGRPRSPQSPAERRRAAQQRYRARVAGRGRRHLRLVLPGSVVERLHALAGERGTTPGAIIEELLAARFSPPLEAPVGASGPVPGQNVPDTGFLPGFGT